MSDSMSLPKRRSAAKTGIDRYIEQATAGLPHRECLDTAAELRVHLNNRVRELLLEGFNQEEAGHVAVEGMGPVAPVNRQLLGHIFTPALGWLVLAIMLLGGFGWYASRYLFAPAEVIRSVQATTEDLAQINSVGKVFELVLPQEAKSIFITQVNAYTDFTKPTVVNQWSGALDTTPDAYSAPPLPNSRQKARVIFKTGNDIGCYTVASRIVRPNGKSSDASMADGCLDKPSNTMGYSVSSRGLALPNSSLKINTWIPMWNITANPATQQSDQLEEQIRNGITYFVYISSEKTLGGLKNAPPLDIYSFFPELKDSKFFQKNLKGKIYQK
jgi:hypothetical protein